MPSDQSQQFEARYGDGKTAVTEKADVRLSADGLSIRLRGSGRRVDWPIAELETLTALHKGVSDIVVRRKHPPPDALPADSSVIDYGATVFVTGSEFPTALAGVARHLTDRQQTWSVARWGLLIGLPVLALLGTFWIFSLTQPKRVADLVPDSWWSRLGDQVIDQVASNRPVCTGADGKAALDKLMARLSTATGSGKQYQARVIDWNLVNAFAVPGGQIIITRGLINAAGSADEVAGVIAHEIGHGLERHPETSVVRGLGFAALVKVFFGGAGGLETAAGLGTNLLQLRHTRDAEREADVRAVETLRSARIAARGLADFFDQLRRREGGARTSGGNNGKGGSGNTGGGAGREGGGSGGGGGGGLLQILSTHPSLDERLDAVRKLPIYPAEPAATAAEFEALKRMCNK